MTQATITKNPMARLYGKPEIVESIEIGHVLGMIKDLSALAKLVNEQPGLHCDAAKYMAMLIREIERAVMPLEYRP